MTNMRSDWKKIIYLLIFFVFLSCAWVIRKREEINRSSLKLHPLSESLLVLPDFDGDIYKYPITFQVKWRHSSFRESQPVLTYKIRADGRFEVSNIELGHLDLFEIESFIDSLNSIGFFCITDDRLLYEYFDVERIYLFGFLIKTKRQVIQNYPNNVTYHSTFNLKNLSHKSNYYGIENVTKDPDCIVELEILRQGHELMEDFFETKALEFVEDYYFSTLLNHKIIPECSLDTKVVLAKKIETYIPLNWFRDKSYTIITKLFVAPDGQVVFGLIQNSGGYRYFDYKTLYLINNIKRFKFTPPLYHGNPVYTWVTFPLKSITRMP